MTDFPTPYTIAIVGAASGIGRATAMLMAGRGATLVCLDRDGKGAAETAAAIIAAGGKASAHEIEITDRASQKPVWDAVLREAGQLHALVNCAGVTGKTNLKAHEVDPDDYDFVYRINMLGRAARLPGGAAAHAASATTAASSTSPPSPARTAMPA